MNKLKLVGWLVLAILIANLLLFAFRVINQVVFWGIIIAGAIFVYKGLPILKRKINNRTITLTIIQDFKELNLKERLTNIYYHKDPNQTRLS